MQRGPAMTGGKDDGLGSNIQTTARAGNSPLDLAGPQASILDELTDPKEAIVVSIVAMF